MTAVVARISGATVVRRHSRATGSLQRERHQPDYAILIAVVALRGELAVLHADRDFDALARRCGLRTQQAP